MIERPTSPSSELARPTLLDRKIGFLIQKRVSSMKMKIATWMAVSVAIVLGIVVGTGTVASSSTDTPNAHGRIQPGSISGSSRTPAQLAETFLNGTDPFRRNVTSVVEMGTTWGRFWAAQPAKELRVAARDLPPSDQPVYVFLIHGDIQAAEAEPAGATPPTARWQVVVDTTVTPYPELFELSNRKDPDGFSWYYSLRGSSPIAFARQ
jgi:hypothetical protein